MEIRLENIKVRDIIENYTNNNEQGVMGYNNKLNIRPKYQREFIYKQQQQEAVISTIQRKLPLNIMYWVENDNGQYEVLDGQQRTLSVCEYVNGGFSKNYRYFHNLSEEEKNQILDYELMIYICKGTNDEKLDWFRTINIAGEKLTQQELRNAVYTGKWLSDAKKYFSKPKCPAYEIASSYMSGSTLRQDYLETAIKWISDDNIDQYMAEHQQDSNANALWLYFQNVISWTKVVFQKYRKEMKGIDFGLLYNKYKDIDFDSVKIEDDIVNLMMDDDVTRKKGIYSYILSGNEKYLNIRAFTSSQKREVYEKQKGICPTCGEHFEINEMEADHILPWSKGGKTNKENCQMLCKACNRKKSNK